MNVRTITHGRYRTNTYMLTAAERLLSIHGWQIELCPNYRDPADG